MTNREYMESLNDEELAVFIYGELMKEGLRYTDSVLGIAVWLGEERRNENGNNNHSGL